ncbi:c-type cytochrome domain-containing protein [Bremerella cremea]|uniref:c-type cytochrome domain-containing protein n=1 Tax=Pirellulaceae TaxID=2691357 RepID=UPI0026D976E7
MLAGSQLVEAEPKASIPVPLEVQGALKKYCNDCHGEDASEGGVRLDNLHQLDVESELSLMNRVQDQLFFGLMPPEDSGQLPQRTPKLLAG